MKAEVRKGRGEEREQPSPRQHDAQLLVEGGDEVGAVLSLTKLEGVGWREDGEAHPWFPHIRKTRGASSLLGLLAPSLKEPGVRRLAVILDADDGVERRLEQVRTQLGHLGMPWKGMPRIPEMPDPNGLVLPGGVEGCRFGLWIMPDNRANGALEDFLRSLVESGDALWAHAVEATRQAEEKGAEFGERRRSKAEMRAWLAWQWKPGSTYQHALTDEVFGKNHRQRSEVVDRFLHWFQRMFDPGSKLGDPMKGATC